MSETDDVKAALLSTGFSKPEIQVYLALLELGAQPASVLAKKAALKRGHTYNVLSQLIQKGIAQEFIKDSVRYFSSRPPNTLLSLLEHQKEEIEQSKQQLHRILPQLAKIQNPMLVQPKVRFFQGVEGIKEIYEDTLQEHGGKIYALADFDYIFPKGKDSKQFEWVWKYGERRAKRKIEYLGIANKSAHSDLAHKRAKEDKRKLKMIEGVYLPVEVNIYGSKVAIMSTHEDMVGIVIEDAPIAETLRNFHQAMWGNLPNYKL